MSINIVDQTVVTFLNTFVHKSELFNIFVINLSSNELLKGGALSAAIWWIWFKEGSDKVTRRVILINTLIASLIAIGITRALVLTLPFRPRPVFSGNNSYMPSIETATKGFDSLSSFPSDHATLTICLALGIYYSSKRMGRLVLLYSLVFILIPRIYLGLHYPTDILAGGMIGALIVFWANKRWFSETVSYRVYAFSEKNPQPFYALFFLFTYETSDLYIHLRNIARFVINAIG